MEESIFGPKEIRNKLGSMLRMEAQPLKEALPEDSSITVLFCHTERTQS
jgi:hypothetical protein